LEGAEREASLARGGDGRVARVCGGWISVGDDALRLAGLEMTLCMRLNDTAKAWDAPLFAKDNPKDACGTILSAGGGQLRYVWRTTPASERVVNPQGDNADFLNGVMRLGVPVARIDAGGWHDVVVRFRGPNLELFVDGVLVDEEWPHGELHEFHGPFLIGAGWRDGRKVSGFHGLIDHVALWNRALTNEEIVRLSGGAEDVARRDVAILGRPRAVPQYWRPRGHNTSAGDCMLFSQGGRLHLFWLFDRRHHASKWGRGGHQWAHWSTADLVRWEEHPRAIPITRGWECSIGTGCFIEYEGRIYAFYADFSAWGCYKDSPYRDLSVVMAESDDCIHFTKSHTPSARGFDSTVLRDPATGLFHLLTPGSLPDGQNGLLDYTSADVRGPWTLQPNLFLEVFGCCPHAFEWNGWHYLWMGNRAWFSRNPTGPWKEQKPERLICLQVPKSAVFGKGRAFAAGWLGDDGWGGDIVFHELLQDADGTLGAKFVPEMMPPCGDPVVLTPEGPAVAGVPRDARVTMKLQPRSATTPFSLRLRGTEAPGSGLQLRFDPVQRSAAFLFPEGVRSDSAPFTEIDAVDGLDRSVKLDIVIVGDIFDICINERRTITARCKGLTGDRLGFDGCAASNIEARLLK
jgi:hypothetical protein